MYRRHIGCLICNNGYRIRPPEARTIAHEEGERSPGISGAVSGYGSVNSGIDNVNSGIGSTSSLCERITLARVQASAT